MLLAAALSLSESVTAKSRKRGAGKGAGGGDNGHARPAAGWPIPGTPGQPSPGDPSYLTDFCRKQLDPSAPPYEGLPGRKADPKHLAAWGKGHPNAGDLQVISDAIKANPVYCPYLTKECVEPDVIYRKWLKNKKMPGGGKWETSFFSKEQWELLPSMPPGSFGTCAVVSLADTIIKTPSWGSIIDAHDTVLRLGHPPLEGFEQHVGSRADAVIGRGATLNSRLPKGYENVTYTLGTHFVGAMATAAQRWDMPKLWKKGDQDHLKSLIGTLYNRMVPPLHKPRGPTTGIWAALGMIFSGLCTRVDVYGMSPHNGGHYFCNRGSTHTFKAHYTTSSCGKLQFVHSPGIENWLLHYIMRNYPQFNSCVYL